MCNPDVKVCDEDDGEDDGENIETICCKTSSQHHLFTMKVIVN